ncbi:MAG: DNA-processing protein DprA [Candidatus Omnitrophota bacterium]
MNIKSRECSDLIALNLIDGLGPLRIKKLLEHSGSVSAIFSMNENEIIEISRAPLRAAEKIRFSRESDQYKREIGYIEKENINVLSLVDEDYPENLRNIYDPPPVLYYKGVLPRDKDVCAAVVGSRRCSLYGMRSAEELSESLASEGVIVVSGMASGVDSAAHRGALKANGRTVAVMGTGFKYFYPEGSEKLAREICRRGAVMTEFPCYTRPSNFTFPRRNRLISGMSFGVVVVEAAKKSGALITADFALEQGKEVFAVPGPIGSITSSGTNLLIQNGAKLVLSAKDILDEIPSGATERNLMIEKDISDGHGKVLEAIPEKGRAHIDEIRVHSGFASGEIHGVLLSLELKGMIKACPGAMYERSMI